MFGAARPRALGRRGLAGLTGGLALSSLFVRRGAAGAEPASPPVAAAAAPAGPVKIGVLTDVSSSFAEISGAGSIEAARMAIGDFGGQALGQPIEFVSADHQGKTDIGVGIARQWYDSGVDVILDISQTSIALAVADMARARGKVVIFTGASSTDLTGRACTPNSFSWGYDTYSMTHGAPEAAMAGGKRKWFILTWDYAVGRAFERDLTDAVSRAGGSIVGSVRSPLGNTDYSAFLLQAQASGADIVALMIAGSDLVNAVKQAQEYRLAERGISLVLSVAFIQDIRAIGLPAAQGALMSLDFYWDQDDATRAFARRFGERRGQMPSRNHALVYSATAHFLKAVRSAGSRDATAVTAAMRAMPVEDFCTRGAMIRADGKLMRDMYLYAVKSPDESRYAWDYLRPLGTVPAAQAFRPLAESECPLVRK